MLKFAKKILSEEEGATALEYGLLTALVALVMASGAVILGNGLATMFGNIGHGGPGCAGDCNDS